MKYIIFMKAPIKPIHYYQNERRGFKTCEFEGTKKELIAKVKELQANGETVTSVETPLGYYVSPEPFQGVDKHTAEEKPSLDSVIRSCEAMKKPEPSEPSPMPRLDLGK